MATGLTPDKFSVSINLGPAKIEGTWVPNDPEKLASWDLFIELVTRISVIELPEGQGVLREALASLHSIFSKTREILHTYGPNVVRVSQEPDEENMSFGFLALVVLNYVLRPTLTTWHPRLQDWEDRKSDSVSRVEHENMWEYNEELRKELNKTRIYLIEYATILANVAGVPTLILESNIPTANEIPETTLSEEKLLFYANLDDEQK
ncbi:MAG: hypothetical protein H6672_01735 [Anaerolineaceae bacterium]|nr:hypothetical protein [Anaerolineaceae bacterium]